ncbi:hypothetical protein QYE76_021649 [Lolium multiflorum]|uniref:Uncharacterized protein n=1 Tax=Lolium multiflorum TaxID=4521 RepID=A0AAD8R842_LOLMU|nr:hypothetical protein QYE76_021649 [Lolium multiflorum]
MYMVLCESYLGIESSMPLFRSKAQKEKVSDVRELSWHRVVDAPLPLQGAKGEGRGRYVQCCAITFPK